MYLEVRHAVLTIKRSYIDLDMINSMLKVALEFDFCEVSVTLGDENTKLALSFNKSRTSVFVEQWVIFWMRPFEVEYDLSFENSLNGKNLSVYSTVAS